MQCAQGLSIANTLDMLTYEHFLNQSARKDTFSVNQLCRLIVQRIIAQPAEPTLCGQISLPIKMPTDSLFVFAPALLLR